MKIKIQKIGRNFNGYGYFSHRANIFTFPRKDKYQKFYEIRTWCWETWGPSIEDESFPLIKPNSHWAWRFHDDDCYIYFCTDADLMMFKLRWV